MIMSIHQTADVLIVASHYIKSFQILMNSRMRMLYYVGYSDMKKSDAI